VRVVSFTGSTEVGRIVNQAAAPTFKKVHLEMGGKNVIIIMDDADLELAVDGCLWGGFGTTGQRCTAASRVVVHEKVYDKFASEFVERTRSLVVGDGLREETDMGPSNSEGQLSTVVKYVGIGKDEGATLASGGHRIETGAHGKGFFHEPTVFTNVDPNMRIAREEIFGPVLATLSFEGVDEAIDIANRTIYGLAAGVWTRDVGKAHRFARDVQAGTVWVNTYNRYDSGSPFGGYKQSGYGRDLGWQAALDKYTQVKSVWVALD
jgi:acyl-CoA reductase-like NAD-dependent aldehyde dehydrogenase